MTRLDLAFVLDCTCSMRRYIDSARQNIKEIINSLVSKGSRDVRFALVEYRDHHPSDRASFVKRSHNFTSSVVTMKSWLDKCSVGSGFDWPEAVTDGIRELLDLSWCDEATKISILVADAPPHGLGGRGDHYPDGCPCGNDPLRIVHELASNEITLYVAGVEPNISKDKDFFTGLAYITGGQYVPLASADNLAKIIICGAEEEMSLEALMKSEVGPAIQKLKDSGIEFDEDLVELYLTAEMARKGITVKKLRRNHASIGHVSEKARVIAEMKDLAQYRATDLSRARPSAGVGAAIGDSFDVEESEVDYAQVQRMVQKSKMRNKALFDD